MNNISHYLYQFPQSKNYYFRFRIPVKYKSLFLKNKKHFTSTLKTADINEAQYLAWFIKGKLFKELIHLEAKTGQEYKAENWDFYQYLKTKFDTYLSWGKKLSASQSFSDEIDQLKEVSTGDMNVYEDYLETLINDKDKKAMICLNKQVAHAPYMLSYLGDYNDFLSSSFHSDILKRSTEQPPLSKPSDAELFFTEQHYDGEFYQTLRDDNPTDSPVALKRFMARHAWIELEFKQHLIKQLKGFKQSYNPFSDTVTAKAYSPVEYGSFLEIIETLKETQRVIKDLKQEKEEKHNSQFVVLLKPAVEEFLNEKKKIIKVEAIRLYQISFDFLYTQVGEDFDICQFDKNKAVEVKKAVMNKETNRTDKDGNKELAVKTINRYLVNFNAFLNWCSNEGKIEKSNFFAGLKIKETKNSKSKHRPYTSDEITKVMSYKPTRSNEAEKIRIDAYWFPKVALYTGMRLNEIAGLTVNDFKQENDIHYINLFDKDLKTETSERHIPIHSKLVDLGFLDFVEQRKKDKQKVLFNQIRAGKKIAGKDGWGVTISKWYNLNLVKKIGVDKREEKANNKLVDFHGLRHTFLSKFKELGICDNLVKQIAGHGKGDDITFDVYGSEVTTKISALKQTIEKVQY
jgi:integrase